MIRKPVIRAALVVIAALCASCIDSREELWIDGRGSGRAEITVSLPTAAARLHGGESGIARMIDDFIAQTPAITHADHEVSTVGERTTVKLDLAFDSALDLAEISEGPAIRALPSAASHLLGEISVSRHGRTIDFKRRSYPGKLLPGAALLPASQLDGRLLTIIHLPASATASNATRQENNGRTLVWDSPLSKAVRGPREMYFTLDAPIPWPLVLGVGTPLVLGLAVLILRLRRSA